MSTIAMPDRRMPWHVWVVAILALLWNGSGAYTIMMAQSGRLPDMSVDERAYYAAQPSWFVVATDIALLAALAGAAALLLRSRTAAGLFAASLVAIFVTNAYDLAAGTSRVLVSRGALVVTVIIAVIAILELAYGWAINKRV
ncbi:MAG TPA: hypothetical protein VE907_22470 [Gammaproteobacteria bacterium]|nr:hypothetical protein [Gammaproteobacteria bacterium]